MLVTDANGCQDSAEITIIEPDSVTMQLITNDLLCAEFCDGEVNIAAFGGSGVFDYSVTDADGNEYDDEDLCVGTYVANAVDENGCVVDSAFR